MKVYIVRAGSYYEGEIYAVFLDKVLAKRYAGTHGDDEAHVEEWETIDAPPTENGNEDNDPGRKS